MKIIFKDKNIFKNKMMILCLRYQLKKMNELKEKKNNKRYLKELSSQDLKRKIECEEVDKIMQKKVNDLK